MLINHLVTIKGSSMLCKYPQLYRTSMGEDLIPNKIGTLEQCQSLKTNC